MPKDNVQDRLQHGRRLVTRSEITIYARKSCVVYESYEKEGAVLEEMKCT